MTSSNNKFSNAKTLNAPYSQMARTALHNQMPSASTIPSANASSFAHDEPGRVVFSAKKDRKTGTSMPKMQQPLVNILALDKAKRAALRNSPPVDIVLDNQIIVNAPLGVMLAVSSLTQMQHEKASADLNALVLPHKADPGAVLHIVKWLNKVTLTIWAYEVPLKGLTMYDKCCLANTAHLMGIHDAYTNKLFDDLCEAVTGSAPTYDVLVLVEHVSEPGSPVFERVTREMAQALAKVEGPNSSQLRERLFLHPELGEAVDKYLDSYAYEKDKVKKLQAETDGKRPLNFSEAVRKPAPQTQAYLPSRKRRVQQEGKEKQKTLGSLKRDQNRVPDFMNDNEFPALGPR